MENSKNFIPTFNYKCIYVFRINDKNHEGKLKIGDATVHSQKSEKELTNNCEELVKASKDRINQYTSTAGISYELLHTELATTETGRAFRDYEVHDVLTRSGIDRYYFDTENKQNEWFIVDLETAKKAIKAVKEGKKSLDAKDISKGRSPIAFRPEQKEAIEFTRKRFKTTDTVLWNAKMRFGKTLTALEVVKEEKYKRTIIITHRPVVKQSWFEDFNKLFYDTSEYQYGSKTYGEPLEKLLADDTPFVYFASIQDLRGSNKVGGKFEKNDLVFSVDWDLVVIDEAHEGTKTGLGERTIEGVVKIRDGYPTKVLNLTGTAFNLISDFEAEDVYTWDYVMEQSAKYNWENSEQHFGDSNPYEDLPQLNIFTYYLDDYLPKYIVDVSDKSFNFKEFFRTWTGKPEIDRKTMPSTVEIGDFMHEKDVESFLNLLVKTDENSNYPFSTDEYRNYFRHSLWMVPGVKEAKALSKLLNKHPVFGSGQFKIVNVAGEGDEEIDSKDALKAVKEAITDKPEETYTITLSCGRLTTGVTVKPWTAVLMLSGSYNTSASSYLQTIFRVQSPANIGGKIKEKCYVFDFAPDRTLNMMAQAGQLSTKVGSIDKPNILMKNILNFCPVIGLNGSQMVKYNVNNMLQQLKKAVAQRVVSNGFDDPKIYNDNLLKLTDVELKEFDKLKEIIGASKPTKKVNQIDINNQGFTDEQYDEIGKIKNKPKRELTEEEKRLLEQLKEQKKQRNTAISILRGISIRIPLLIYGADIDIDEDVTIDNFTKLIDDKSWEEFMPAGITKDKFDEFSKYYDNEVFIEAGRQIRRRAKYADNLSTKERIQEIAQIFGMFRNPDKETVLTPWKTVNMHISDCLGGYNFNFENEEPRFISQGNVTYDVFNNSDVKILEINSKTGLYALYCAYSIYMNKIINYNKHDFQEKDYGDFWKEVVESNIYVVCKTKMARQIVKRTLVGYNSDIKTNIIVLENMTDELKNNDYSCCQIINNPITWNQKGINMNFDAIVGNPPYQYSTGGGQAQATPLYDKFVNVAFELKPHYVSMIMPARWYAGGFSCLKEFREKLYNEKHIVKLHDYPDARECFNNVEIKGGVCYFLGDTKNIYNETEFINHKEDKTISIVKRPLFEKGCETIIRNNEAISILHKVLSYNEKSFSKYISTLWPFTVNSSFESLTKEKKSENDIFAYVLKDSGWIRNYEIKKNVELISKYKLFIPRSIGSGNAKTDVIKPILGKPNTCCSGTYVVCGPFKNEEECENVISYINTKFFYFLISLKKVSQDRTKGCYEFIPVQNFESKITDRYLYKKYKFNNEEIDYIEKRVRDDIGK